MLKRFVRRIAVPAVSASLLSAALPGIPSSAASGLAQVASDVLAIPSNAANLGAMPPSQTMDVMVTLQPRPGLHSFLQQLYSQPPAQRAYLTPAAFGARFGNASYTSVASYLQQQGLNVSTAPGGLAMEVTGTVQEMEAAFHVTLNRFQTPAAKFFSATAQPLLPSSLAANVTGVMGLSSQTPVRSQNVQTSVTGQQPGPSPTGFDAPGFYLPSDIHAAYNINKVYQSNITGAGQSIAIMTLANVNPADVSYFWQHTGLPAQPTLKVIPVDWLPSGPPTAYGTDESTLDAEYSGAMAPGATILEYVGSGPTLQAMVDTYWHIISQDKAQVITCSWGAPEDMTPSAFISAEHELFMQAAAQGMSNFSASGDSGAYSDPSSSSPVVTYPASDPYVSAAGGTSVYLNPLNGSRVKETAWSYNPAFGWGSGGGFSAVFPEPAWQQNAAIPDPARMNGLPDVALNADPFTGYQIYYQGSWSPGWGGTSFASPEWAGITALANQALGKPLGFVNPLWFALGQTSEYGSSFHSITIGNNGAYSASPGWNPVTGWGTPDVSNLVANLQSSMPMYMSFAASNTSPRPGQSVTLTATVTDVSGAPVAGQQIQLNDGNTSVQTASTLAVTNANGQAAFTAADSQAGPVQFTASDMSAPQITPATVTVTW